MKAELLGTREDMTSWKIDCCPVLKEAPASFNASAFELENKEKELLQSKKTSEVAV